MIPLIIIFGLLGLGIVLVAYGTVAMNKWGINWDPVSCPRCKTPLPRLREARSLQQAMWGAGLARPAEPGLISGAERFRPLPPAASPSRRAKCELSSRSGSSWRHR